MFIQALAVGLGLVACVLLVSLLIDWLVAADGGELEALSQDPSTNGRQVLDGRNRLVPRERAGIEPRSAGVVSRSSPGHFPQLFAECPIDAKHNAAKVPPLRLIS